MYIKKSPQSSLFSTDTGFWEFSWTSCNILLVPCWLHCLLFLFSCLWLGKWYNHVQGTAPAKPGGCTPDQLAGVSQDTFSSCLPTGMSVEPRWHGPEPGMPGGGSQLLMDPMGPVDTPRVSCQVASSSHDITQSLMFCGIPPPPTTNFLHTSRTRPVALVLFNT